MSIREMRSFTEQLRGLGYPQTVSMESFRTPNFNLMSQILYWLINNYDPRFEANLDFSTEANRVNFVKTVATFIAPKTQVKLNTRNLYKADGSSIKELLKISSLLIKAKKAPRGDEVATTPPMDLTSKIAKLKACRQLATSITEKGAELFDLLGREIELRDQRNSVISRPFELMTIEKAVTESIENVSLKLKDTIHQYENLQADESNLTSKIEKKKQEYDRAEKRLRSLQSVRPAYMDEYEKIEVELVNVYQDYMEKFRNLAFLEQQLDEYNIQEQDKFEETESTLKRMQNRLRAEELKLLREGDDITRNSRASRPSRPAAAGSRTRVQQNNSESDEEDEFDEDEVSIDSDLSRGEIEDEDEVSGPEKPGGSRKSTTQEAKNTALLESDEEDESSIDLIDDEEEVDDNDF